MKIRLAKLLLCGIAFAAISIVIHTLEAFVTMSFYLDPQYWQVWSKVMMPGPGPPGVEFYAASLIFAGLSGVLYAFIFDQLKPSIPGKKAFEKGTYYGTMLFMIAGLPGTLSMFLLINIPLALITVWAVTGWVVYLLGGMAIVKIMGK
ncbi:MAG: hypothetical protein NTW59_00135 [Candidatus Diapherotrites archaeon]|nr:hypothetical protein [Candidatus Diapherotrites archaeon]